MPHLKSVNYTVGAYHLTRFRERVFNNIFTEVTDSSWNSQYNSVEMDKSGSNSLQLRNLNDKNQITMKIEYLGFYLALSSLGHGKHLKFHANSN